MKIRLRGSSAILAGTAALATTKGIAVWLIAVHWGAGVQGAVTLAAALTALAGVVVSAGHEYSAPLVVGEHQSLARPVARAVWRWILLVAPIGIGLVALVALAFRRGLSPILPGTPGLLTLLLGITAIALAAVQSYRGLLLGLRRYDLVAGMSFATGACWAACAVIVPLAPPTTAAFLLLLVAVVPLGLSHLMIAGLTPPAPSALRVSPDSRLRALGIQTLPGSLLRGLHLRGGLYLAALWLTPRELGVLGMGLAVAEAYQYLPNAFAQIAIGDAAARVLARDRQHRIYAILATIGGGAVIALLVLAPPIVDRWLGPDYRGAEQVTALLLAAATIHGLGIVRLHERIGMGDAGLNSRAQLAATATTLAAQAALLPTMRVAGAAGGMLIGYTVFTAYLFTRDRRPPQ